MCLEFLLLLLLLLGLTQWRNYVTT